jgi:deazaflavin-dependent oxidoreductase (nitroreductase family)
MGLVERKPAGVLRLLLRSPIWLYRAHLGWLAGHRLLYLAHRGRRSGARREVVAEVVGYDPAAPAATVIAAWGGTPDWYRNLLAAPAIEVRVGTHRWTRPCHRILDGQETLRALRDYQRAHPRVWRRIAPLLGFPVAADDPRWPEVAERVHAVTFSPRREPAVP